jgi:hypothetical protein
MEEVIEQTTNDIINNRNYIIVYSDEGIFLPKFYGGIDSNSSLKDRNENYYYKISTNFFVTRVYDEKLKNDNTLQLKEMNNVTLHLKNTLSKEELIKLVKKVGIEVRILEYNCLGEVLSDDIFKLGHVSNNSFHFDNNKRTNLN